MSVEGRVIAGKYRHHKLVMLHDDVTRATKDRVKEAIFSALSQDLTNKTILDLFAGTGALGIEAISRGASKGYFVEKNSKTAKILLQNVSILEEEKYLYQEDYLNYLNNTKDKVDIVFVDPPYDFASELILQQIIECGILNKQYIIVLETDKEFTGQVNNAKIKKYKYGITHVAIIRGEL